MGILISLVEITCPHLPFKLRVDPQLPINDRRDEIAATIRDHQVVIVCGQTGSGKSTQLGQICLQLGRGQKKTIGHTQPRRLAARTLAIRIAAETRTPLGQTVGYKVRFGDETSKHTRLKLMTDGILLAESQHDPLLRQYDTLILDEAHERSLNVDFLLGYLKQVLPRRPDLKIIVTSATIDPQKFSEHFDQAPIIEVSGRMYPVEVRYQPLRHEQLMSEAIAEALGELTRCGPGDVLVFLPTERDISETAHALRAFESRGMEILPLFARLATERQMRVFTPKTGNAKRRVILATNVAETSVTVPGIHYVIDTGQARISRFSSRAGVQRLPIEAISQASADQRKGRCGRVASGVCIRLYAQEDFEQRDAFTTPEILRSSLGSVILQMKALKIGSIATFPFLDPPKPGAVRKGFKTLHELGAVDEDGVLTKIGKQLAAFPIDPRLARMLLAAAAEGCLMEIIALTAAMSVPDPRQRPADAPQAADEAHVQFRDEKSDFLTLWNLWQFIQTQSRKLSNNQFRKCCKQNFLSFVHVRQWQEVHHQLTRLCREQKLRTNGEPASGDAIHRALLSGLLSHLACAGDGLEFRGTGGNKLFIFPGSVLFKKRPAWIMAGQLVDTARLYARTVAPISPQWIEPLAPHLIKRSYLHPRWDRLSGRALVDEKVMLLGLTIVPRRTRPMDVSDVPMARQLFLHHALVEQDFNCLAPFMAHNQRLLRQVQQMEAQKRTHDLLADQQHRFDFFDKRLPQDITNGPQFEKWLRKVEKDQPRILFMKLKDLLRPDAQPTSSNAYPTHAKVFGSPLKLSYRAEYGHEDDGVTVRVPIAALDHLDAEGLHRMVPGLLGQKIEALLRAMPKAVRRQFIPIKDVSLRCVPLVEKSSQPLAHAICQALEQITGYTLEAGALNFESLPDHLKPNVRVVDQRGRTLAKGRDLAEVTEQVSQKTEQRLAKIEHPTFTRQNITRWDFGDLPKQIKVRHLPAWPALVDEQNSVSLQLFESEAAAATAMRGGLRRLFVLQMHDTFMGHIRRLSGFNELCLDHAPFGSKQELIRQLTDLVADRTFIGAEADLRTQNAFVSRFDERWGQLANITEQIGSQVRAIFKARRELDAQLEQPWPTPAQSAVQQICLQRDRLMSPSEVFLLATPPDRLEHIPRYLQAMMSRLEKLQARQYTQDAQIAQSIDPYWQVWLQLTEEQKQQPHAIRLRWMIEEFCVARFAQHLGTSQTVSAKRLDKQVAKVQRQPTGEVAHVEVVSTPQLNQAIGDLTAKFSGPWEQK